MMKISESLGNLYTMLHKKGDRIKPNSWQAQKIDYTMVELENLFFEIQVPPDLNQLAIESNADLPWAEDHFMERLDGPSNPGKTYKWWPYYKQDEKWRDGGVFSHTYQERFWPPKKKGVRYPMGNLNDIINRLNQDSSTRQAFLSIWHPEDHTNTPSRRLPCTIGYWFKVKDNILSVTYLIRSCDAIRHLHNDIYLTGRLLQHVAESTKNKVGQISMWIGSLHCFESDLYELNKRKNNVWNSIRERNIREANKQN